MQTVVQGLQVGSRSGQHGRSAVGHVMVGRGPGRGHARSQKVQLLWTALENFNRSKIARGILVQVQCFSVCAYNENVLFPILIAYATGDSRWKLQYLCCSTAISHSWEGKGINL